MEETLEALNDVDTVLVLVVVSEPLSELDGADVPDEEDDMEEVDDDVAEIDAALEETDAVELGAAVNEDDAV